MIADHIIRSLSPHMFGKCLFVFLFFIMSTNSFAPFGDVVVNTPGGSLEDCFDSDEKQRKIIYEYRQYHFAMMHFHDLECNGPGDNVCPGDQKAI